MQYKYRCLYIFSIILFVFGYAYFGFLRPDWLSLLDLQRQTDHYRVSNNSVTNKASNAPILIASNKKSVEFLPDLMRLLQTNGLVAQTVNIKTFHADLIDALDVAFDVQGEFKDFLNFARAVSEQPDPLFILNFVCKLTKNEEMLISFDVLRITNYIDQMPVAFIKKAVAKFYDPFCHARNTLESAVSLEQQTKMYSLKQMHYVGFVTMNGEQHAFVRLPNNQVINPALGATLGSEQGRIHAMTNHNLVVQTPANKQITLVLDQ